jgi:hypothetical protein
VGESGIDNRRVHSERWCRSDKEKHGKSDSGHRHGGSRQGIERTVTELLLKQGKTVRAMVRNEDERAQALRDMGAEVGVGGLLANLTPAFL